MKKTIYLLIVLTLAFTACKKKDIPVDDGEETVDFLTNRNIVALYGFNENTYDESKNRLHLRENDITYSEDRNAQENSSVSFDGEYSYLRSNYNTKLNLSQSYTLSVWIKPDLKQCKLDLENYIDIFGRWSATGSNTSSYSICLIDDGKIQGRTYNSRNSIDNTWIETQEKVIDREWNNIIVTRDETGYMKIYLNGIMVANEKANAPQYSSYELYIGKRRDDWSYYAGDIDDIIILNEYTNQEDIEELMNYNIK